LSVRQKIFLALSSTLLLSVFLWPIISRAQSGRNVVNSRRTLAIPVIAQRVDDPNKPKRLLASIEDKAEVEKIIGKLELELFDGSVQQKSKLSRLTRRPRASSCCWTIQLLCKPLYRNWPAVPAAFAPEIYEGDKVMVIGYDSKPEVITEFTDKPEALQNTLELLRKTDAPHLFDALNVTMEDVLRPEVGFSKRVIVIVGDGLDRDSSIKFDKILGTLQDENITVYAIRCAIVHVALAQGRAQSGRGAGKTDRGYGWQNLSN
jgi:hypothetical protein